MEKASKTEKKKEALSLQDLGERLLHLTAEDIKGLDLPEKLFDAVMQGKMIKKHGALNRQVQYIGALMRKIDPQPIEAAIRSRREKDREGTARHKQAKAWRKELIGGNDELRETLLRAMPEEERPGFVSLVARAREEAVKQQPDLAASRMLYRMLHALSCRTKAVDISS